MLSCYDRALGESIISFVLWMNENRKIEDFPTVTWLTRCRTEIKTYLSSLPAFSTLPCCLCKFTAFKSIFMSIEQDRGKHKRKVINFQNTTAKPTLIHQIELSHTVDSLTTHHPNCDQHPTVIRQYPVNTVHRVLHIHWPSLLRKLETPGSC